jgi:hypothetical protein
MKVYVGGVMGVQTNPTDAISLRKSHRHPMTRELGVYRRQSERFREGKQFFPSLK